MGHNLQLPLCNLDVILVIALAQAICKQGTDVQ